MSRKSILGNDKKLCKYQKVKLITSLNLYENSANENYEIPVFRLTRNPLEDEAGVFIIIVIATRVKKKHIR